MKTLVCIVTLALGLSAAELRAQNEPNLIPDVADPAKLIPILPEPPAGWTAEQAEGSSDDVGGFKITNAHRDYSKGECADAPRVSLTILACVANPDYGETTSAGWEQTTE